MLTVQVIGRVGADAEIKESNGNKFASFRVAHSERRTDRTGAFIENTTWVDCVISADSGVVQYIKKGSLIYVTGNISLRVYSSKKDRCMKAGLQVFVKSIELLGNNSDAFPKTLYGNNGSVAYNVLTYHAIPQELVSSVQNGILYDLRGRAYKIEPAGWINSFDTQEVDNE